jgi:orotate phosphoribosyltransferase
VVSIVSLEQVLTYLEEQSGSDLSSYAEAVRAYRDHYGIAG